MMRSPPAKLSSLHQVLYCKELPLPISLSELKLLRASAPGVRMSALITEVVRARNIRLKQGKRRDYGLFIHLKAHDCKRKLIEKSIERLQQRRYELQYCSKRARPIPLYKQL